jgi:hypothetical protein
MKNPLYAFLLAAIAGNGAVAGSAAAAASSPNGATEGRYFRMKQVEVIDRGGFEKPMPALHMMVPTDWQFEGQVSYGTGTGCIPDMAQGSFQAHSADGALVLEGFPMFSWRYADNPLTQRAMEQENRSMAQFKRKPCPVAPPVSAAELLRQMVIPKYRPGKSIAGVEPLPEFAETMRLRLGLPKDGAAAPGGPSRAATRVDAARARLQYDDGGRAVEEWITAVTVITATPGFAAPGQGTPYYYDCHGVMMLALRAPRGQLAGQDKLFKLMGSTLRRDPQWGARIDQMIAKSNQVVQQEQQKRQAIVNQTQQDIFRMQQEGAAHRAAAAQSSFEASDQIIRGVQTYRNPETGSTFELSNQYNHAWMNGSNEYIMSDDPNFNPNAHLNGSWTALQPVKPQ